MELAKNNPAYISLLLFRNDRAVERAIVAIYKRQTEDEKFAGETKHSNGVGFSGSDAKLGTYWANWILSGKTLSGNHLLKARRMSLKYIRQLSEIVTEKMVAKSV